MYRVWFPSYGSGSQVKRSQLALKRFNSNRLLPMDYSPVFRPPTHDHLMRDEQSYVYSITPINDKLWLKYHPLEQVITPVTIYTDASKDFIKSEDPLKVTVSGSMVIFSPNGAALHLQQYTNIYPDIQTAELYALYSAITFTNGEDILNTPVALFTDSLQNLKDLYKYLTEDICKDSHKKIMEAIRVALLKRSLGSQLYLGWVKAHKGIFGNVLVDGGAKLAALLLGGENRICVIPDTSEIFTMMFKEVCNNIRPGHKETRAPLSRDFLEDIVAYYIQHPSEGICKKSYRSTK